jgi:hypothetical protein
MRNLLFLVLLLFSFHLDAKKAPKWKPGAMQVSKDGIRYSIKKQGKGEAIKIGDVVRFFAYCYNPVTKKFDPVLSPGPPNAVNPKTGSFLELKKEFGDNGLVRSLMMLKPGGEGFFIIPGSVPASDSSFYFLRVMDVSSLMQINNPTQDSIKIDSVNIAVTDPARKNYGDTLFSVMKLIEVPQQTPCGTSAVIVAFKFELTWFDNGTQRKNILVFVECPELYGKDYFVQGASYVITAVPMTENYKSGHRTMNGYSLEKLESYYGLRLKKMGG